jgi:hypothetical protein
LLVELSQECITTLPRLPRVLPMEWQVLSLVSARQLSTWLRVASFRIVQRVDPHQVRYPFPGIRSPDAGRHPQGNHPPSP